MADATNVYAQKVDVTGLGEEFSIPAAWSDDDVNAALLRSTQTIDSVTRNHFGEITQSYILDGTGTDLIYLDDVVHIPVQSITSIQRRDSFSASDDFDSNGTTLDTDLYVISRSRRSIQLVTSDTSVRLSALSGEPAWVQGTRNYKVTATFGYPDIPEPIKWACVLLTRDNITPGSTSKYESYSMEQWPDGYRYERQDTATESTTTQTLTGNPAVDKLLWPFVSPFPLLGSIV